MIIELILATLALTAAGSAVVALRRRWREQEHPPALMAPRDFKKGELLPNDVIVYLGTDYLVEGVATFLEAARPTLVVAWLTEGRYLVIDVKEQPRCVLAEARDTRDLGHALPSWIPDGDLELRLSRRASVRVKCEGECDLPEQGASEFGLYKGPGDRKAVMILSKDSELLAVGKGLTEAGVQLLPGGSVVTEGEG